MTEAGATSVGGIALHLRGEVRDVFMDWLRAQRPDLVPRYEKLYRRGAYAPREERARLSKMVRRPEWGAASGSARRRRSQMWRSGRTGRGERAQIAAIPALQTSLF